MFRLPGFIAAGEFLAIFGGKLHACDNFTSAGGDNQATFIARHDPEPKNTFKVGGLKLKKSNGTATISVKVPGPDVPKLSGRGVR